MCCFRSFRQGPNNGDLFVGAECVCCVITVPQLFIGVNYLWGTILSSHGSGREKTMTAGTPKVMMMAKAILSDVLGKASEIDSLTRQTDALNRAVDRWNTWMLWGLAVAVIAALWVGIATRMVVHRSKQLSGMQGRLDSAKERELRSQLSATDAKRIALENRMLDIFGPRQLTPTQSAEMAQKLRGLTGLHVDVFIADFINGPNSDEFKDSVRIGRSILDALNAADLDAEAWMVDSCGAETSARGLSVATYFNAAPTDEYFAAKILAAFPSSLGFVNKLQKWEPVSYQCRFSDLLPLGKTNNRKPGAAKIMVIIGTRTQPILTREMLEPPDEQNTR